MFCMVAELVWLEIPAGLVARSLCKHQMGLVSGVHNLRLPKGAVVVQVVCKGS